MPFLALGLAAVAVAAATLVEASQGTAIAHQMVYGTGWFRLLWFASAASGLYLIIKRHLWRRSMGVFGLHLSLLVILLGAFVTSLTSHHGMLHLRQGEPVSQYMEGDRLRPLPCTLRLDSFSVQCYPGTSAPQDYVSLITLHPSEGQMRVSMNRIGHLQGYRIYQSSYDEDRRGSILSITYDPWGTAITYAGYALLGLCMMLVTWPRKRRAPRRAMLVLLMSLLGVAAQAARPLPSIARDKAAMMAREQVVWNGRVAPMGTMCQEFLL